MAADIVVIFQGAGRRSERAFTTIAETVDWLVEHGYTRPSGQPYYAPQISTRLYKASGSGRYARINTYYAPGTWPVVVGQVAERAGVAVSGTRPW